MPGVYMDQLIWYDGELHKDNYVKGAAIFAAGASQDWESYEILGHTMELLTQYLQVHRRRSQNWQGRPPCLQGHSI